MGGIPSVGELPSDQESSSAMNGPESVEKNLMRQLTEQKNMNKHLDIVN